MLPPNKNSIVIRHLLWILVYFLNGGLDASVPADRHGQEILVDTYCYVSLCYHIGWVFKLGDAPATGAISWVTKLLYGT